MAYESRLPPGIEIFDDSTREHEELAELSKHGRGLQLPAGRASMGYAYEGVAQPFPRDLIIEPGPNESNWKDRIKYMEDQGNLWEDELKAKGVISKDQAQTSLCWANGPVGLVESHFVRQGQGYRSLSPASVAARVNGFKNQGGWGKDALEQLINQGVNESVDWPDNAWNGRQYDTPGAQAKALLNRVTGWFTGQPRDYVEHVSMCFHNPTSVGLDYWGHQVNDFRPVIVDGKVYLLSRNSWGMDYPKAGSGGWFVRTGNKKYADDIICIAGVSAG